MPIEYNKIMIFYNGVLLNEYSKCYKLYNMILVRDFSTIKIINIALNETLLPKIQNSILKNFKKFKMSSVIYFKL